MKTMSSRLKRKCFDGLIDIYHQDYQMIIQPYEERESSDEGENDEDDSDFSDNED